MAKNNSLVEPKRERCY